MATRPRFSVSTMSSAIFAGRGGHLVDRPRDIEQILAGEFLLRIGRRVAAGLDPEALLDDRRVLSQKRVDFVGTPQIERPLRFMRALVSDRPLGILRRWVPSGGTLSASSAQ